jgi:hypothetical protein
VPWSKMPHASLVPSNRREIFIFPLAKQSLEVVPFNTSVTVDTTDRKRSLTEGRVKQVYNLPDEIQVMPFIKLPSDNSHLPAEYQELPSLEDFFQEVVPEARVKKTNGVKAILLRNIENPKRIFFYSKSPLLLVDNKIVTNQEVFLAIPPNMIQSIDFTWRTQTINQTGIQTLANTGVISVFTKEPVKTNGQDIFRDFSKPLAFSFPAYERPASTRDKLPDFRSTLFWNPSFKINANSSISFYLSDDLGNFIIEVVGKTEEGRFIRQSQEFSVAQE